MGDWYRGLRGAGNGRDDFSNQSLAAHGRALKSMGPTTFTPGSNNRPQRPPPGRVEQPRAAAGATPEQTKLASRSPGLGVGPHTPVLGGMQQPARNAGGTPHSQASLPRNKRPDSGPSPYGAQDTSPGHDQTPGSPKGSVMSLDLASVDIELDTEGDSVQVFVRIRPPNAEEERQGGGDVPCVQPVGTRSIICNVPNRSPHQYTFDQILWQTPQTDMFDVAGVPMVENCMAGYNSSIFAYGQTGAGKTYTMLGMMSAVGDEPHEQRGLAPRVFEYLFQRISSEEDIKGRDTLRYSCRCSFLEIYNETITDLLNPSAHNLQIREDQRGCFVEALSEVHVQHADDVMALMRKGAENRHVGETRMNRESSRSHSVFTCIVEKSSKSCSDGVTSVIVSRLNLIDLAGSERIASGAMGGSQVQGNHFKEAVHINKSLTTLGRVIMELVESQRSRSHCRHIPYRDSRLTFLLQDSLGGNAKTMIIANISPSIVCSHETSSTLQFVQRAKCIRNRAHVNLDYRGDVAMLQREIQRLNKELEDIRQNNIEAAFQEAANLRDQLSMAEKNVDDLEQRVAVLTAEGNKLRRERLRLEEKLTLAQNDSGLLGEVVNRLKSRINIVEQAMDRNAAASRQEADVVQEMHAVEKAAMDSQLALMQSELAVTQAAQHTAQQQVLQLQAALDAAQATCVTLGSEQAATRHQLQATESALEDLKAQLAAVQEQQAAECERGRQLEQQLQAAQMENKQVTEQLANSKTGSAALSEQLHGEQNKAVQLKLQLEESQAACAQLTAQLTGSQAECAQVTEHLTHSKAECVQLAEQLISSKGECMHLTEQLTSNKAERAQLAEQLTASKADSMQLTQQLQAEQAKAQQLTEELRAEHTKSEHLGTELEVAHQGRGQVDTQLHDTQQQLTQKDAAHQEVCQQLEQRQQELASLQQRLEEQQATSVKLQVELDAAQEAGRKLQDELGTGQTAVEKLQAQLTQETEEHAATQAALCAVRAELEEVTERWGISERHAAELDSLLQQEQERVASLARELDAERSMAAEAAALHESTLQQLQQDLGQGSAELLTARKEHEQLSLEHQDAITQGVELQTALDEEQAAHWATQATLDTQTQLCKQTAQQVAELQQELANEKNTRTGVEEELARVQAALSEAKAEGISLQDNLSSKQAEATAAHQEVAQLTASLQDLKAREAHLAEELAAVNTRLAEQVTAREASEQQCTQLQRELDSSQHTVEALSEEMESMVTALLEEKSTLLTVVEQQQVEIVTLKADGAQAMQEHQSAAQQLQQALEAQEAEVARVSKALEDTKAQLASTQQQLHERDHELTIIQKDLAQANKTTVALNNRLTSKEDKLRHVKQTSQEAEVQAGLVQKEQQERISYLQREIIRSQEQLVSREFELKSQVTKLSNQLEAARTEQVSLVRQLDNRTSELQTVRTTLAGNQDTLGTTQTALADCQRELAEVRRKASDDRDAAQQLQAKQQATISELCQELVAARSGAEQQIKTFVVRDTRQNRAFQEIRRLIEWATTPPSSGRSSVGPQPDPLLTALGPPEAGGSSPLQPVVATARGQPPTPTAKLSPLPEESPEALRNSARAHIAALYRLRSSLSLAMASDNNQDNPGSPTLSTSPGMASPKQVGFKSRCTTHSPRSSLAADLLRASVDAGLPKASRAASSRQAASHGAALLDDTDDVCSPRLLLESRDQSLTTAL